MATAMHYKYHNPSGKLRPSQ